jgi:hypothetical protein
MADKDTVTAVDPFEAMAKSRLAADEREFKTRVISEITALKVLVHELIAKLEVKESKKNKSE